MFMENKHKEKVFKKIKKTGSFECSENVLNENLMRKLLENIFVNC